MINAGQQHANAHKHSERGGEGYCVKEGGEEEEVLFIGTQFSNLSTAVDTGEEGERERERAGKVLHYSLGY